LANQPEVEQPVVLAAFAMLLVVLAATTDEVLVRLAVELVLGAASVVTA
jgi:hypothetical protein